MEHLHLFRKKYYLCSWPQRILVQLKALQKVFYMLVLWAVPGKRSMKQNNTLHYQAVKLTAYMKTKVDKDIRRMFCLKVIFGKKTMLLSLWNTNFKGAVLLTSKTSFHNYIAYELKWNWFLTCLNKKKKPAINQITLFPINPCNTSFWYFLCFSFPSISFFSTKITSVYDLKESPFQFSSWNLLALTSVCVCFSFKF